MSCINLICSCLIYTPLLATIHVKSIFCLENWLLHLVSSLLDVRDKSLLGKRHENWKKLWSLEIAPNFTQ